MFTIIDIEGVLLATLVAGVLIGLPGIALARAFGGDGADRLPAVPTALAVLPAAASLVARLASLDTALALDLALAGGGLFVLARRRDLRPKLGAAGLAIFGGWLALVLLEWVDYDIGGALYRPSTIIDTVKHAATTQAILDSGAPPRDAFFLRPERASYYYFFYTLTALVQRACFGLADARAAVGGAIVWVGLGLYGLIALLIERSAIPLVATRTRRTLLILAILCAGGLDVVAMIGYVWRSGVVLVDPLWWNEQVSIWSEALFWVPHHVTALISSMIGLVALAELGRAEPATARFRSAALAAFAFAATLGLSVWVCLGLVATTAIWGLCLVFERRWRHLALILATGLGALLLSLPTLADLHVGRGGGPLPIAVSARVFSLTDQFVSGEPWRSIVRIVALPLNYLIEFGVVAVGSWLYWARGPRRTAPTDLPRVLAIAAVAGLALGAVCSSTLHNNDLGWRVTLFPMAAGSVWTIAVLDRALAQRTAPTSLWSALPPRFVVSLVLGWGTSLVALGTMRAYAWLPLQPVARFMTVDLKTARELRTAYGWADSHLPAGDVLQHNPGFARAFAFGLYGRNPIAVSDSYASLYGADANHVDARLDAVTSLYRAALPAAAVKSIARRDSIDDLVVTSADPVWNDAASFVWTTTPIYASDHVRIIPIDRLGG